jgi:hypothetical protein
MSFLFLGKVKTAEYIAEVLEESMMQIGVEHVVQV